MRTVRFPAPWPNRRDRRRAVMLEIARQASEAWGMGTAITAHDFMRYEIPRPAPILPHGSAPQSRFKEPSFDTPMSRQIHLPLIHEDHLIQATASRSHEHSGQSQHALNQQNVIQSRKVLKRRKTSG